jgi:tRNA(Ile)-lysidine synthase
MHTVLVGVSGGPDSVALLRALHSIYTEMPRPLGKLVVGHVNHGLRGPSSDRDQVFVESLAGELGLQAITARLDSSQWREAATDGLEAAARSARHAALAQMAHDTGSRYLALGHTIDDQVETVLFRIFRGTGIAGVSGIPAVRTAAAGLSIVRPLLQVRRADVVKFLEEIAQATCEDETNFDRAFSRNWLRHELLPLVRGKFPGVDQSVLQLAQIAGQYQVFATAAAAELVERAVIECGPNRLTLRREVLSQSPRPLAQIALQLLWAEQDWPQQDMGFDKWQRLVEMTCGPPWLPHQMDFPGQIRASCQGDKLYLRRMNSAV